MFKKNILIMSVTINNLSVAVDEKIILNNLNLILQQGQVVALMGPNGSGKSTLANTLMGHPKYNITEGSISIDNTDITPLSPDKRSKLGLFLSMQYPPEIHGVTISQFLRLAYNAQHGETMNPLEFTEFLNEKMKELDMNPEFARRSVNAGFSGGEKKRAEILQLAVLNPTYAVLDETDSGLDVDALKIVAEGINRFRGKDKGVLLITHYNRLLNYVVTDVVYIMMKGKIVKSGGKELAEEIEKNGYSNL
jgi:Fe-S cluster assembly ATP-binding protein